MNTPYQAVSGATGGRSTALILLVLSYTALDRSTSRAGIAACLGVTRALRAPYLNVIGTSEQTVRDHPEVVQAFVTASLAGWKAYIADPTATLAYIKQQNKDTDPDLAAQAAAIERPFVLGPANDPRSIGMLTEHRFKDLHNQLREVGLLKANLDYPKFRHRVASADPRVAVHAPRP